MPRKLTFREKVKREQKRQGISTWRLSRESGVPRSTLQGFLAGRNEMTSRNLTRTLITLEIAPDWLKRE